MSTKTFIFAASVTLSIFAPVTPVSAQQEQPSPPPPTASTIPADQACVSPSLGPVPTLPGTPESTTGDSPAPQCLPELTLTSSADLLKSLLPSLTPSAAISETTDLKSRYTTLSSALGELYVASGTPQDVVTAFPAAPSLGETGSVTAFTANLATQADDVSAAVVTATTGWVQNLQEVRMPKLATPEMAAPTLEQVAVGAFTNQALTTMVSDFPDLFATARNTGLGTPETTAAWKTSMNSALDASIGDLSSALPSPCHASLLTAMGSGNPTKAIEIGGEECRGCIATGLYMNGQMGRLFSPGWSSLSYDPSDNIIPPAEFRQLQPWQRDAILSQNPSLADQLPAATASAPEDGCGGSPATAASVNVMLPEIFAALD